MGCGASKSGNFNSSTILIIGPQEAGKTSILYQLALGQVVTTIPTFGFNVETITHQGDKITLWDFGGSPATRKIWKDYYFQAQGILFVVDSSNTTAILNARIILQTITCDDQLDGIPIVVMANKKDLETGLSEKSLLENLGLYDVTDRLCCIISTSAMTGEGLHKSLDTVVSFSKRWRETKKR